MNQLLSNYILSIRLGEIRQGGGLSVIPLFAQESDALEYLTMNEALEQSLLTITEISQGGSVPQLQVENRADLPVLVLDGEELAGAKQNRVLNTSILLKENTVTIVPVSCTEQGRWSYNSPSFKDSGNVMSPSVRHHKIRSVSASLRERAKAESDQGQVWDGIHRLSQRSGVSSPTGAMSDIFRAQQTHLDDLTKDFKAIVGQNGLLVLDSHKVVGLDIVSSPKAFKCLFGRLLRSYAMDLVGSGTGSNHPVPMTAAEQFLKSAAEASVSAHASHGYGNDCRLVSETVVGSALVINQTVVHMALFAGEPNELDQPMFGPSRRRRFHS